MGKTMRPEGHSKNVATVAATIYPKKLSHVFQMAKNYLICFKRRWRDLKFANQKLLGHIDDSDYDITNLYDYRRLIKTLFLFN